MTRGGPRGILRYDQDDLEGQWLFICEQDRSIVDAVDKPFLVVQIAIHPVDAAVG